MILSSHTEINEGVPSTRVPGLEGGQYRHGISHKMMLRLLKAPNQGPEGEQYRHGISHKMMLRMLKAPNQGPEGEQQKGAVSLLSLQARGGFLEEVALS